VKVWFGIHHNSAREGLVQIGGLKLKVRALVKTMRRWGLVELQETISIVLEQKIKY
jgi:hypothetical protein